MQPTRRIGIVPDLVARPLFSRFHEPGYDVVRGVPGALAVKLREQQLDGAFLSPIDAARGLPGCRPAGGGCLAARAGSNTAKLLFRSGIRDVRTVAVDPGRTSEIVLAHLVLIEQYDLTPRIVPMKGSTTEALSECDAALVAGDEASGERAVDDGLDLIEEWMEIADLPFVHGLWYARDGAFESDAPDIFECAGLRDLRRFGRALLRLRRGGQVGTRRVREDGLLPRHPQGNPRIHHVPPGLRRLRPFAFRSKDSYFFPPNSAVNRHENRRCSDTSP